MGIEPCEPCANVDCRNPGDMWVGGKGPLCPTCVQDHFATLINTKDTDPPDSAPPTSRSPVSVLPERLALRDYFAGCALTALIPSNKRDTAVQAAYEVADMMLEARSKTP